MAIPFVAISNPGANDRAAGNRCVSVPVIGDNGAKNRGAAGLNNLATSGVGSSGRIETGAVYARSAGRECYSRALPFSR
jgi:hypothetical protein